MAKVKQIKEQEMQSIDQLSIAKQIAETTGISVSVVSEIIELEQKLTMKYVRDGCKVIKKNYVTFTPVKKPAYKLLSKLNNKNYDIPERVVVRARVGQGFKAYVSDSVDKMPDKICRFVDNKEQSKNLT